MLEADTLAPRENRACMRRWWRVARAAWVFPRRTKYTWTAFTENRVAHMVPTTKCNVCGRDFTFDFATRGSGKSFPMPNPRRVRHCANGNYVDVPGEVTRFCEVVDGKLIEVAPIVGDLFDT
jgi:hypothetical protein